MDCHAGSGRATGKVQSTSSLLWRLFEPSVVAALVWFGVVFASKIYCHPEAADFARKHNYLIKPAQFVDSASVLIPVGVVIAWILVSIVAGGRHGAKRVGVYVLSGSLYILFLALGTAWAFGLGGIAGTPVFEWFLPVIRQHLRYWLGILAIIAVYVPVALLRRNKYGAPTRFRRNLVALFGRVRTACLMMQTMALEQLRTGSVRDAKSWNRLGTRQRHFSHRDAITSFSRALALDPCNARALHMRGDSWRALNELRKSEEDIVRSLELDPKDFRALSCLGVTAEMQGRSSEAAELYARAIELNPDDVRARELLAWLHINESNFFAARRQLLKVIELDHTVGMAYHGLFLCEAELLNAGEAKKYFQLAKRHGREFDSGMVYAMERSLGIKLT